MKTCLNCGDPLTGKQERFCSKYCSNIEWRTRNPEAFAAASGHRSAKVSSWLERRAAIVAKLGVPGMGTKGGRPTPRVIKGEKF